MTVQIRWDRSIDSYELKFPDGSKKNFDLVTEVDSAVWGMRKVLSMPVKIVDRTPDKTFRLLQEQD